MLISMEPVSFAFPSGITGSIRGMTGAEQNMLADKKKFKAVGLDGIIRKCIAEPKDIDLGEILIGDKFFIIFQIRRLTYGNKYKFKTTCPYCDRPGTFETDLSEYTVKYLKDRKINGVENEQIEMIPYTFPVSKQKVYFRLLKGKDEKAQMEIAKIKQDKILTSTLMLHTEKIEGENMVFEEFFEKLPGYDLNSYREFIEDCDCGIETETKVECTECDAEFELDLPLTADFFYPKKIGKLS